MLIIPRGTDPNVNNETTIAFDKVILEAHAKNWSKDEPEPTGITALRERVEAYEAEHGVVDAMAVEAKQDAMRSLLLGDMEALSKKLRPNG